MNDLNFRPLRDATEARFCAEFMAASDPWSTLGITCEQEFLLLTNPDREVHVAEIKNRIAGVLVLHLGGPLNGYIQIVAVHPDWRGSGVGTRMMTFAEDRIFRQSPNVFLCVSDFNERAQNFYEGLGYKRVGELPDYLVKGFSEILMRKTKGPLRGFVPNA